LDLKRAEFYSADMATATLSRVAQQQVAKTFVAVDSSKFGRRSFMVAERSWSASRPASQHCSLSRINRGTWETDYIKSVNGNLRDECLNGELFLNLADARYVVDCCRMDYNHRRPHSRLDWKTPATFVGLCSSKGWPRVPPGFSYV